ncbi:MAG: sel1 repeat family protein [Polyangiaceae bacterium]|nr:sel1 repeat family protein [Polyangiaceae bacterium]
MTEGLALERHDDLDRAVSRFENACDAGRGEGCRHLSRLAFSGIGPKAGPAQALAREEEACAKKDGVACATMAERYWTGDHVYPNSDKAIKAYLTAITLLDEHCKSADASACHRLGVVFTNGWGIKADGARAEAALRRAAELWAKACDGGDAESCLQMGKARARGRGVAQDVPGSIAAYERACEGGAADACIELASARKSDDAAVRRALGRHETILSARCERKIATACHSIASVYVAYRAEPEKAAAFMQKACDAGHGLACRDIARKQKAKSPGADTSIARTVEHLTKACDAGDGPACGALGEGHLLGELGPRDAAKGKERLERGCDLADAGACITLGQALASGRGLSKDANAGRTFFEKACALGRKEGCDRAAPSK